MHNIDRTQTEAGPTQFGYEMAPEYTGEYSGEFTGEYPGEFTGEYAGEFTGEYPGEFAGEYAGEFTGEYPAEFAGEYAGEGSWEYPGEFAGEYTGEGEFEMPGYEALEMELAAELLEVTNEAELERFLGRMFKRVGGFFRRVVRSPIIRSLGGALKGIAGRVLPLAGGALGSMIAPGIGTAIGSSLGSMAGRMFGAELEGLSPEDREFEVARRYVRLASSAMRRASFAPQNMPPEVVARRSLRAAARRHAPGLVGFTPPRRRNRRQYGGAMPAGVPGMTQPAYPPAGIGRATPAPAPQAGIPSAEPASAPPPSMAGGDWPGPRRSGRWIRRGNSIVLLGADGFSNW